MAAEQRDFGICHLLVTSGLLPSTCSQLSKDLGFSRNSVRAALYRGIRPGRIKRLGHGLFGLGDGSLGEIERSKAVVALQALKARQAVEATWPMDETRISAAVRAIERAKAKRWTSVMMIDSVLNALRFGIMPPDDF